MCSSASIPWLCAQAQAGVSWALGHIYSSSEEQRRRKNVEWWEAECDWLLQQSKGLHVGRLRVVLLWQKCQKEVPVQIMLIYSVSNHWKILLWAMPRSASSPTHHPSHSPCLALGWDQHCSFLTPGLSGMLGAGSMPSQGFIYPIRALLWPPVLLQSKHKMKTAV